MLSKITFKHVDIILYMYVYKDVLMHVCLHQCLQTNLLVIKQNSCDCWHDLSLLLHKIESLFVQRTNEVPVPIPRSLPCPTKGLFLNNCDGHTLKVRHTWNMLIKRN